MKKHLYLLSVLCGALAFQGTAQAQSNSNMPHATKAFFQKLSKASAQSSGANLKARPTTNPNYFATAIATNLYDSGEFYPVDSFTLTWHKHFGLGTSIIPEYNNFFDIELEYEDLMIIIKDHEPIAYNFDFNVLGFKEIPNLKSMGMFSDASSMQYTFEHAANDAVTKMNDASATAIEVNYHANGKIESQIEYYTPTDWEKDSAIYDSNNRLIAHYKFSSDRDFLLENTYTYDANGNKIVRTYSEYDVNSDRESGIIDSLFAASANVDSVMTYYWNEVYDLFELTTITLVTLNNNKVASLQMIDMANVDTMSAQFARNNAGMVTNVYMMEGVDTSGVIHANYNSNTDLVETYATFQGFQFGRTLFTYDANRNMTELLTFAQGMNNLWMHDDGDVKVNIYYQDKDGTSISKLTNVAFNVYPNPTNSAVTVAAKEAISSVNIYDVAGRMVKTIVMKAGTQQTTVDVSNLAEGAYQLEVNTATGKGTQQFIKM